MQQTTTTTTTVTELPDERRWQGRDWVKLAISGALALALLRPGVSTQPAAPAQPVVATPIPAVVSTPMPTMVAVAAPVITSTREAIVAGPYTVRGTGEPGTTVEVLVNGAPVGTAVVGADGNWSLDTELAAGTAELQARAIDAGGQVLAAAEPVTLNVGVAAAAPTIRSTREAIVAGPYTVRGTGEPGTTVEVLVNGAPVGTAVVGADGNWSLDTELAAGTAELQARAIDAGGQVLAASDPVLLNVGELAAPTFDAPAGDLESGPVTLTGTGVPGTRVRVRSGDTNLGTAVVGPDGRWELESILAAGRQPIIVEALDANGNPVATSAPTEVNVTGGLGVTLDAPTEGTVLQPGVNVISGKGQPGIVLEILNGDRVLGEATVGNDGTWRAELPLDQGTAAISVRVKGTDQILNRPVRVTIGEAAQIPSTCTEVAIGCPAWVTRAGGLNLRMRSAPAITPDNIIARLPIGTEMMVEEGPQSADGFTWWRVTTVGGQQGWVAGENLVPQPD